MTQFVRRILGNARGSHPAVVSGFTAGTLFMLGGLYTFVTILFPTPPGFQPVPVTVVALVAIAAGLVAMLLPWDRIPDLVRLALSPAAMALIACHNIAAGRDAFRYGMFFFLVFIWLGLCEPRGTSLKSMPFLVAAYIFPLYTDGVSASDYASITYALPLYLTVGEVLAWRSRRLRRLQARLRQMAEHDALTGLPNRTVFTAALRRSCAAPEQTAVLFLDLDGFKQINDRLGHAAGDDVLVQVAGALREAIREGRDDLACRLAGDEFVMLLPDTDADTARTIADRLVRRLGELRAADGTPVRGSIGVAAGRALDPDRLIGAADQAMYSAKQSDDGSVAVGVPQAA